MTHDDPAQRDALTRPKRRRFQFSLRAVLVFTAVCAMLSLLLGRWSFKTRQQREAIKVLIANGVKVYQGEETIRFERIPTDDEIECVRRIWTLRGLIFENVRLGNRQLEQLQGMASLEALDLRGSGVTDDGLCNLTGLCSLRILELDNTPITDVGLRYVSKLANLQYITLNGTQVTDQGMRELHSLAHLSQVEAMGTEATERAATELKSALPTCEVHVETRYPSSRGRQPQG